MGILSSIYRNAISYNCANFGAFVNSETILMLRDLTNQTKVSEAFEWLLNCEGNSYKQFIKMRHFYLRKEWKFNVYDYNQRSGIETALWPHLYPYDDWCETFLTGNESRISTKV